MIRRRSFGDGEVVALGVAAFLFIFCLFNGEQGHGPQRSDGARQGPDAGLESHGPPSLALPNAAQNFGPGPVPGTDSSPADAGAPDASFFSDPERPAMRLLWPIVLPVGFAVGTVAAVIAVLFRLLREERRALLDDRWGDRRSFLIRVYTVETQLMTMTLLIGCPCTREKEENSSLPERSTSVARSL